MASWSVQPRQVRVWMVVWGDIGILPMVLGRHGQDANATGVGS
jgi:hypothetical protein